jgi:CRISPR-associated endonuclease/helicase Cas3
MRAVHDIGCWAREAFPAAFEPDDLCLPVEPRFHHRFAGLVMLADWLGSDRIWFPIEHVELRGRMRHGREVVKTLLRAVGLDVALLRPVLKRGPADFRARFANKTPRPIQAAVDALDPDDERTKLVIVESETGSGKTEAALDWFFKLFATGKVDSLYFALPTRVAAREIYTRVRNTIERWFPDPDSRPVTVLAVPGYPLVDGLPPERLLAAEENYRWQDDDELRRRERQWAGERPKRFLAATVAVGTIDQALLSVVQTAHAHLRSVCLDRSLLVVDEVHASDVYMSRLLEFLLDHHLSIGGRAMLLSATLGARARCRYVAKASRSEPLLPDLDIAQATPYPAITLANGTTYGVGSHLGGAKGEGKRVHFEDLPLAFEPQAVADYLIKPLAQGARILVVMNTVGRANALLRALEANPNVNPAWLFKCEDVVCPHHGRFAPEDRVLLDARVSERLGPCSPPGPVLLVGTQTLEQSLDIDCDLMVSDLAPADVLLQRVGRLHRHRRPRPSGFETPRCLLLAPGRDLSSALEGDGHTSSEYKRIGYGSVYEDLRTLELTRRVLLERTGVSIPQDNRRLVEAVTHPERLASLETEDERWARHARSIEGVQLAQAIAAGLASTVFDQYFGEFQFNESGGKVVVRLGADTLQLPLDRPIVSPFGQTLLEMVIPGHLAPSQPEDRVTVVETRDGVSVLRCGDRRYCYSRYGLEEVR